MQPRPSFDRVLPILIAIGVVLIFGVGCIFLTSDLGKPLITPTVIPPSFSSLEEGTPTPSPSTAPTQDKTLPTATGTSLADFPGTPPGPLPSATVLITESIPTPSAVFTPHQTQPLRARGKYDDADPNIVYDRYWAVLKNPGTKNAYKGAIHISSSVGNEASFRFTGKQFYLGYQRGKNFGTVTVSIDDQPYSFNEQTFDLFWRSPQVSPGDHFVRIIHESGESINVDYIVILD